MKRLAQPIWTFLKGYLISTNDTFDAGLETMVFPASDDARINEGFMQTYTDDYCSRGVRREPDGE